MARLAGRFHRMNEFARSIGGTDGEGPGNEDLPPLEDADGADDKAPKVQRRSLMQLAGRIHRMEDEDVPPLEDVDAAWLAQLDLKGGGRGPSEAWSVGARETVTTGRFRIEQTTEHCSCNDDVVQDFLEWHRANATAAKQRG